MPIRCNGVNSCMVVLWALLGSLNTLFWYSVFFMIRVLGCMFRMTGLLQRKTYFLLFFGLNESTSLLVLPMGSQIKLFLSYLLSVPIVPTHQKSFIPCWRTFCFLQIILLYWYFSIKLINTKYCIR
jgi:hypothetical protein